VTRSSGRVVVLGGGSTGEAFAAALRRHDPDVPITMVERGLVGGECSYYACMPTKALLRPGEALAGARNVPGSAEAVSGPLDADRVFWHRDEVTSRWDDSGQSEFLAERTIELVRGEGRIARPGVLEVDGRELTYERLAISTGSVPSIPPIEGLAGCDFWTNREATTARAAPSSLIVLGAGPVGCELAQFFARLGTRVALVDIAERLLPRDDADAAAILDEALTADGIELHLGVSIESVESTGAESGFRLQLAGGASLESDRLLVATGRKANVEGFGFDKLGVTISKRGIEVDDRLRAADGVWAIGDVTGIAMFTHVGKYQARIAAADAAGLPARADYRAIPAVTFTDPQVGTVGQTSGEGLVAASWDAGSTARASTYARPRRPGLLKVFADPSRRVLVGGVAVGPEAGEWLGQLTLAVKAEVPIDVLRETIQPYPTFSEAMFFAVRDLQIEATSTLRKP
jgi:pyruvate/2-oxoglutarate dehydrogenase complex dihydrolipoamide dehydrogenase (E3) component